MKIEIPDGIDEINRKRAELFFNIYNFEHIVFDSNKIVYLGNKNPRHCRFCQRTINDVTFKKKAHVIAEFMGNKNLLSYFECDECNNKFSLYEDSFAKFIGASRTFSRISGKSGIPKHKDINSGLSISYNNKGISVELQDGSEEVKINRENKTLEIFTKRQTYIPIHVLKSIIKIGFCLLSENDLMDYEYARKFLQNDKINENFKNFDSLRLLTYFIPGPVIYSNPIVYLFDKKKSKSKKLCPQKQIVIYYGKYIFQMIMPFSEKDKWLQGQKINLPIYPLLIESKYFEIFGQYQQYYLNLSDSKKVKNQEHKLSFSFESIETKTY